MNEDQIQQRRRDQDEQSTKDRAAVLGLPYLDARDLESTLPLVRDVLSVQEMYQGFWVPLLKGDEAEPYRFGVTSQTPQSLIKKTSQEYADRGLGTQFLLISSSAFKAFMRRFDPPKEVVYDDITIAKEGDSETVASVSQTLNQVSTDRVFEYLIEQADKLGASDIHIENQKDSLRVRMRIHGVLHIVAYLDRERYRVIMSALASRANISTAAQTPQSGHMQQDITNEAGTHLLNLRIETVPTVYGQDAVMRLFNFDESLLNIDLLGLGEREREQITEVISHPSGMVMMVGPTGSGKSTTLYSILNSLNTPDRKIITLEDPVEFSMPGLTQIPIDTTNGYNFGDGLRSVLRLDPDVVMVGEIRDQDTAKTAIQASITGHLVLSSFHANSTSAAFSRMIDLIGVNPIFSSAIRLVIAQRLVRKLIPETREAYEPDEDTKKYIRNIINNLPKGVERPDTEDIVLYRPVPTDDAPFGYVGRIAIMEQLIVDEPIQAFLRGEVQDVHAETIEKVARKNGMVTLLEAGVLAALRGETTLEEVMRVV